MDPLFKQIHTISIPSNLFSDVGFCTSGSIDSRLIKLLTSGGARQWNYAGDGVSHFISGKDVNEIKLEEAKDIFEIPIVSPRWILHCSVVKTLLPTTGFRGEIKQLFSTAIITASSIYGSDIKSIVAMISYHGGSFTKALGSNCTHLITNKCVGRKFEVAQEKKIAIVSPDWVFDSVQAGRLLDVQVYHPQLFFTTPQQETTLSLKTPLNSRELHATSASAMNPSSTAHEWRNKKLDDISPVSTACAVSAHTSQQSQEFVTDTPNIGQQRSICTVKKPYEAQISSKERNDQLNNPRPQGAEVIQARMQPPVIRNSFQLGLRPNSAQQWTQHQQLEIIRQIQSDPQIKQQWALMDHQQRTLLIQKLAQRNREEHLRREMMLRQQQISHSSARQSYGQTPSSSGQIQHVGQSEIDGNSTFDPNLPIISSQSGNQNQNVLISQAQNLQYSSPVVSHSNASHNQKPKPSQGVLTSQMVSNIDTFRSSSSSGVVEQSRFNLTTTPVARKDSHSELTEKAYASNSNEQNIEQVASQQDQLNEQYISSHPSSAHLSHSQSQKSQDSIHSGPKELHGINQLQESSLSQLEPKLQNQMFGTVPPEAQRQSLPAQHTAGDILRPDEPFSSSNNHLRSNMYDSRHHSSISAGLKQKYFSSNHPSLDLQGSHAPAPVLGSAGIVRTQQTFTPEPSQHRLNLRHVLLPQTQQHQLILQPHNSPAKPPIVSQRLLLQPSPQTPPQSATPGMQWSPTATAAPGKSQQLSPIDPPPQPWTIRSSPQHQTNLAYPVQVVNSKTKTALANLLSNRLLGSVAPEPNFSGLQPRSPSPVQNVTSPIPASQQQTSVKNGAQQVVTSVQHQQIVAQRRSLSNSPVHSGVIHAINSSPGRTSTGYQQPQPLVQSRAQFFTHDPNVKLPPDGFLLGCVFWAAEQMNFPKWKDTVRRSGGTVETVYCIQVTHVLCETQRFPEFQQCLRDGKRMVTLEWLSDVCTRRCVTTPFYAIHLPLPFALNEKPLKGLYFSTTGFQGDDRERVKRMCNHLGANVTSVFTRAHVGLVALRSSGKKFEKAREWKKPVVNIQFLNELMFGRLAALRLIHSPKYQHFNTEQAFRFDIAMAAHLLASWKVPIRVSNETFEKYQPCRQSAYPDENTEPATKRRKLEREVSYDHLFSTTPDKVISRVDLREPPVIILSGFSYDLKELLKSKVEFLGGHVTDQIKDATHLVVKEKCLTKKLFIGISCLTGVVSMSWLRDSYAQGRFIDIEPYLVCSSKTSDDLNSGNLISPKRKMLLSEFKFYVTPSLRTYQPDLMEIIRAAGGQIDQQTSLKTAAGLALHSPTYVIVTCPEDDYLTKHLTSRNEKEIVIINRDTILDWILCQEVKISRTTEL